MKNCKRCNTSPTLDDKTIEKMVEDVKKMKGVRLVSEAEFQDRFKICLECEKLEYGSTCMLCGCVMQVRARLKDGRCPYPKNRKW